MTNKRYGTQRNRNQFEINKSLPYIKGISESIGEVLKKLRISATL
jgi:hypothetical protein